MGLSKTNSFKYFSLQPDMYISLSAFSLPAEFLLTVIFLIFPFKEKPGLRTGSMLKKRLKKCQGVVGPVPDPTCSHSFLPYTEWKMFC